MKQEKAGARTGPSHFGNEGMSGAPNYDDDDVGVGAGVVDNPENAKGRVVLDEEESGPPTDGLASNISHGGTAGITDAPKLSKNQLKRQRKFEQAMEKKRGRKEQDKEARVAKAKAEGRDLEVEKAESEKRRKDGAGWTRRNQVWLERFEQNASHFQVCLDCSFEDQMTAKEINSLSSQIRYCYATNKRVDHPVKVTVTSFGGETRKHLENVSGFDQWMHRAFFHTEKDLLEAFPVTSSLVYLTSDAEATLDRLEDGKVYIIGGIVDRNRLKRAAIDRAQALGIATAKLPIGDYLDMVATKVLTCNHVFDLLVRHREHQNDWKATLLDVLPVRKDAIAKENKEDKTKP